MTDSEIKQVLKDIFVLTNSMDREHLKALFQILTGEKEVNLCYPPVLRKSIKKKLTNISETNHPSYQFNHKQIKQMYAIMGDYGHYPVCKLCGKPIYINSQTVRNSATKCSHKEFTWDHIQPKSLGGTSDLSNLQETHKLCNNIKGSTPPEESRAQYQINIVVNICFNNCSDKVVRQKTRNVKKFNPALRKQDGWCHKHRKYHFGRRCGR